LLDEDHGGSFLDEDQRASLTNLPTTNERLLGHPPVPLFTDLSASQSAIAL
jgi:hypothetical protein